MKQNLDEKLARRVGKKANPFVYNFLIKCVVKPFLLKPMHLEVKDNVDTKNIKNQFMVISNHTSRCDWMYVSKAFDPHPLNYMISYTEFKRNKFKIPFTLLHTIPKKNFTTDLHMIKEVSQVIKDGGNVVLFPEGKSSISGTNQPIMQGTGKLIKHFKLPVYVTTIRGGYMSNTQWNIANRPGKVIIEVNQLVTAEECETLSVEEIENRITKMIYNDDFEWNKTQRISYKGNNTVANKLEEHLFWCPKCHKELTMKGNGNVIKCEACGNGATINDKYDLIPLNENCVIPKTLRVWYELQRRHIYQEIKNDENYYLEEEIILKEQPSDRYIKSKVDTALPVGTGTLRIDRKSLTFKGVRNGEPFEFETSVLNTPTLLFETDSSYFGSFVNGTYYEFLPSRPISTKWVISCEELHRAVGGKWKNNIPQQQWIYEDEKDDDLKNYYL